MRLLLSGIIVAGLSLPLPARAGLIYFDSAGAAPTPAPAANSAPAVAIHEPQDPRSTPEAIAPAPLAGGMLAASGIAVALALAALFCSCRLRGRPGLSRIVTAILLGWFLFCGAAAVYLLLLRDHRCDRFSRFDLPSPLRAAEYRLARLEWNAADSLDLFACRADVGRHLKTSVHAVNAYLASERDGVQKRVANGFEGYLASLKRTDSVVAGAQALSRDFFRYYRFLVDNPDYPGLDRGGARILVDDATLEWAMTRGAGSALDELEALRCDPDGKRHADGPAHVDLLGKLAAGSCKELDEPLAASSCMLAGLREAANVLTAMLSVLPPEVRALAKGKSLAEVENLINRHWQDVWDQRRHALETCEAGLAPEKDKVRRQLAERWAQLFSRLRSQAQTTVVELAP